MKKTNLEHKALRPVRETSGFTPFGSNKFVCEVESRGSARRDVLNEKLGQLPDLIMSSASAFVIFLACELRRLRRCS
jgi:hypothetical protein